MNNDLSNLEIADMDKTIEKVFKKYILEVDDTIEAHGFKATSNIDYAEDSILELQKVVKTNYKEHGPSLLFKNLLEMSLSNTATDIVNYTVEDALTRNNRYTQEKIEEKAINLHEDLKFLNERLLNSFEN